MNEHTGRYRLRAPRSCAQLPPSLSATHRPLEHSPPPPVQSLRKQSDMSDRTCFYSTKTPNVAQKNFFALKPNDNICCHISGTSVACEQDVRMTADGKHINTCCDHGFETGLLVNARPDDVAGLWSPVTERQEAQSQAHPCRHGNYEAARHTPDTCYPEETKHADCVCLRPIYTRIKGAIHFFLTDKNLFHSSLRENIYVMSSVALRELSKNVLNNSSDLVCLKYTYLRALRCPVQLSWSAC